METKEALLRLQKLRVADTWALCSIKTCGKWRLLAEVRDPAEVKEMFTCRDCPDQRFASCEAPEQTYNASLEPYFVENSFTVGSLVWARMDGLPAWPAMVDDDPDTGSFFWTEGEDKQPSHYHVVFFEVEPANVSRSWISRSRLRKFDSTKPSSSSSNSKLLRCFEQAVQAGGESLEEKYWRRNTASPGCTREPGASLARTRGGEAGLSPGGRRRLPQSGRSGGPGHVLL